MRLATGNSYRSISKVFGIGLTSVAKIVYEFCESIFEEARQFIKFPTNGHETALEIKKFSNGWRHRWNACRGFVYVIQKVEWTIFAINRNTQLMRRQM